MTPPEIVPEKIEIKNELVQTTENYFIKYRPFISNKVSDSLLALIIFKSVEAQVDPALILSIVKAESNFNPLAISKKGAIGLMQVHPIWCKVFNIKREELFDPETNLEIGCKILKINLSSVNTLENALALYNWGKIRKDGRLPKETKNYIKRVKFLYKSLEA